MPTGDPLRPARAACRGTSDFEPSVALAILDGSAGGGPEVEAGSAWDAAWIACLTNSPRWAETARLEFARATGRPGAGPARTVVPRLGPRLQLAGATSLSTRWADPT